MSDRPKFFDDLAGVAGGALSAFAGLREELGALVRARVEEAVRRLDLVKREDFEVVSELARRAREQVDALALRVAALESGVAAMPGGADVGVSHLGVADLGVAENSDENMAQRDDDLPDTGPAESR